MKNLFADKSEKKALLWQEGSAILWQNNIISSPFQIGKQGRFQRCRRSFLRRTTDYPPCPLVWDLGRIAPENSSFHLNTDVLRVSTSVRSIRLRRANTQDKMGGCIPK
jgi:hypothetical protein